jgi:hypothetical protein
MFECFTQVENPAKSNTFLPTYYPLPTSPTPPQPTTGQTLSIFFPKKRDSIFPLIDHPPCPIRHGGLNQRDPLISPISPSTRASLGASFYWVFNQNNIVLMLKCLKYHYRVTTSGTQLENPAKSMNLSVHLYRTKVWCTQRVGSGQFLLQNNQDSHLV